MSRKPYLAAIAAASLLVVVSVIYAHDHSNAVQAPPMATGATSISDGPVPALTATTLAGDRISTTAERGKPMLINFFAWWCHPCNQEAPALATIGRRFAGRVAIIGVSTDPSRSHTQAYLKKYGWTWPIVMDGNLNWATAFEITGQPWTFLVNRSGQIVWKHPGAISVAAVSSELRKLLAA
jgi:peroxiredoxin